MPFGGVKGFQILQRQGSFVNTEKVTGSTGLGDIKSFGDLNANQFFGFLGGNFGGSESNIQRFENVDVGYIVDTVTQEKLGFQYTVTTRDAGGANFATHQTLSRSVPHFHYVGGKERTLDLPITFSMREQTREDVKRAMRFLQGLAYPDYQEENEVSLAPHPVVVIQGELYSTDLWLVRDFSIQWGDVRDPITQIPTEATCNLALVEISSGEGSKSYDEVIRL